jgi:tetratricopeptide (TPR) repeat protein
MRHAISPNRGLKHLPFFETLAEAEEGSAVALAATAGLLTLRLVDHWLLAGAVMVEPDSVSVQSVRRAIMALPTEDAEREVLLGLVNAMQSMRDARVESLMPRLAAYGAALEKRTAFKLAADVYETVARLGEDAFDGDLVVDAFLRLGYCRRTLGELNEAEGAYKEGGRLAKRRKETRRMLRARMGLANVLVMRGNLPKAESLYAEIQADAMSDECTPERAQALHGRSVIAQRSGRPAPAINLAYEALTLTESPAERERVLADLAAFLIVAERYDAARDALMILDVTAINEFVRHNTLINMVALAARSGDRQLFVDARMRLSGVDLAIEAKVNLLIESGRGFRAFDDESQAQGLLREAVTLSEQHGLNRSVIEAESLLQMSPAPKPNGGPAPAWDASTASTEQGLRRMAAELVGR